MNSGEQVIFYYGAILWQAVGSSETDALKINILSGALSILSCLCAIALIDKIGRKPLLLVGSIGMAGTLGILTWCFSLGSFADGHLILPEGVSTIALFAASIYVICFNFSWGPVMWVMLGEMSPNQIRGSGLAVAGAAQGLANFAISFSFPGLAKNIGLPVT